MGLYVVGELEFLPHPLFLTTDAERYRWHHCQFPVQAPN
jgi:hypothetical protein